jgi:hypothetical protein
MRQNARAVLALVTAYALALQVVLLAVACPLPGGAAFAATPICSHSGAGGSVPAPPGQCCGCLGACLAGCGAAPASQRPSVAVRSTPGTAGAIAVALDPGPLARSSVTGAHRSRAPPLC